MSFDAKCKLFEDALNNIDLQDFIITSKSCNENAQ